MIRGTLSWACGLALLLALGSSTPRAEVSFRQGTTLIAAITDGSDPFGSSVWHPLRGVPSAAILNPGGADRGDGPPDVQWDAAGRPYAVWAYNLGSHHDIAFSRWTGQDWSAIEFLGAGPENALDPRIHVAEDGTAYVAWWTELRQRVWTARRPADTGQWSEPHVQTSLGKRPTVAAFQGVLRVAFEVSVAGFEPRAIAVVREDGSFEAYLSNLRQGRLDPVLHALGGRLWLDYKAEDHSLGVHVLEVAAPESEPDDDDGDDDPWSFSSPWRPTDPQPWLDPSWVGVEDSRRAVQFRILQEFAGGNGNGKGDNGHGNPPM